jgi:ubiquinone/menaquinone biosynthesis C-methylase UbiE
VLSKETKIPLDEESLDGALLVNMLHESTQPKALLKETSRLLRKSGWLGLIDWRKIATEEGPPVGERLEREDVVAMAVDNGFRVQSHHDINEWSYFLLLLK